MSDIHVTGHGIPGPASVPDDCATGDLTPAELTVEYALFEFIQPCVEPSTIPPPPPALRR